MLTDDRLSGWDKNLNGTVPISVERRAWTSLLS